MSDTISAISTAQGRGGIAVIRVSGEKALPIARAMCGRENFTPNLLYAGVIDCGPFRDYGMCVYFRAPHSFTGEDTVEFHCHGGTEIARGVLRRTLSLGARLAEAGEFTKRAFLNGKLTLSAAEGMGEMIAAQSEAQVRAGFLLYGEKLSKLACGLQKQLKECLASIDADVDYPEEELSSDLRGKAEETLNSVVSSLARLKEQYRSGRQIKEGVNVAICGAPNAGKSSLLNALLGFERAIVSPRAGTTRDTLDGGIEIKGVLFRLTDTAGIRESDDELEREGVRRTEQAIGGADVVVWLRTREGELPPQCSVPVIAVGAKCDLSRQENCDISVSSVTGEGLEELKELLYERGFGGDDGAFLLEERHYRAVSAALEAAETALRGVREGLNSELYAEDVKRAYVALGEISGETASENIIEEIFSKFCVGK